MSVGGSIRETYAMQLEETKKDAEEDVKSARETLKKILKEMRTIIFMLTGLFLDDNELDDTKISCAESLKRIHDLEF